MNRRGQSAIEFVLLIAFMFFVFFIFFFAIQSQIVETTQSLDVVTLEELTNIAKINFDSARQSSADYTTTFLVPDVGSFDYTLELQERNTLTAKQGSNEYVRFLPYEIKGRINYGSSNPNIIYHSDGYFWDSSGVLRHDSKAAGVFVNLDAEDCALKKLEGSCPGGDCYIFDVCP